MAGTITPQVAHERARVASLSRSRIVTDSELCGARRNLAAAKIEAYIERVVDEAPPLTQEQRDRLAALLRGGIPGAAA